MSSLLIGYALVGGLGVLIGLSSSLLRRTPLTAPLLGLVLGVLAGPVTGLMDLANPALPDLTLQVSRTLLAVSLMAVALRFDPADYRAVLRVTVLLTAGMLGMALITSGLAWLLLGLPVGLALLLGACLTPTDPVLASSVVSGGPAEKQLPTRLRAVLSGESGANDGLAYPLVVLALVLVAEKGVGERLFEAFWGIGGAVVIGVALGVAAGRGIRAATQRVDVSGGSDLVFTLVLAIAALGIAGVARTDGILAVFVTGLSYNVAAGEHDLTREQKLDDALTRYLVLPLFFLLGVELPWEEWGQLGWYAVAFPAAVLLLRRLPLLLALRRALGLPRRDTVFLGWFGPIGVSALFYLALSHDEGATDRVIWTAGTLVVVASTLVHGVTAMPFRRWYAGLPLARRSGTSLAPPESDSADRPAQ
ncbi:cation:proton antiporter [Plantactinospora sp. GCM10030261]|uniref:cation:proton antiporter domain-containing protein n=1 Tax=Plantactinospora sp. GCM10030261 TaxID=3273420 RepID=UPI0036088E2A